MIGGLPPGILYDSSTKQLSGTPTASGRFVLNFNVTSTLGDSNWQSLTMEVGSLLTITSPYRLLDGALGQPYSLQLQTANATPPVVWSLTTNSALPTNLLLSSSGLISGTDHGPGLLQLRRQGGGRFRTKRGQGPLHLCRQSARHHNDFNADWCRPVDAELSQRKQRRRCAELDHFERLTAGRLDAPIKWLLLGVAERSGNFKFRRPGDGFGVAA